MSGHARGMQAPPRRCRIRPVTIPGPRSNGDTNLSGAAYRISASIRPRRSSRCRFLAVPAGATHIAGLPDNPVSCVADPLNCGERGSGRALAAPSVAWWVACPALAAAFRALAVACRSGRRPSERWRWPARSGRCACPEWAAAFTERWRWPARSGRRPARVGGGLPDLGGGLPDVGGNLPGNVTTPSLPSTPSRCTCDRAGRRSRCARFDPSKKPGDSSPKNHQPRRRARLRRAGRRTHDEHRRR